jgi:hypothetical protein
MYVEKVIAGFWDVFPVFYRESGAKSGNDFLEINCSKRPLQTFPEYHILNQGCSARCILSVLYSISIVSGAPADDGTEQRAQ